MPERTKKDHKQDREAGRKGSRWHNFHFSGKLISCSVIFGFLLILVGGILLAIGMDRDEEKKSHDEYGDLQQKPPLVFVGPVIMGIGGFTVVVGVIMCLVETKVFRRRGGDDNPLIHNEGGEFTSRDNEAINSGTDPTAIPSDSKNKKHRHSKKSHKNAGNGKKSNLPKSHSSVESSPSSSQSSEPIGISGKGSRNFLNASDTFLTPPGSFTQEDLQMQGGKRDAVNQTGTSLMKSFNSSGTYSTEFQTPSASFIDTPSFPSSQESTEVLTPKPFLDIPANLNVKSLKSASHEFLTPQNSNADILESPKRPKEVTTPLEENSPVVHRHAFLTPKNSADLLEESPPIEESLEHHMGNSSNHPDTFVSKKSPDKVNTINVVADVHEPSLQHASGVNNAPVGKSTKPLMSEEVEHSDIIVDVLILDEEVKRNTHSNAPHAKGNETGKSPENIESNPNLVTANAQRVGEDDDKASNLSKENVLTDRTDNVNELTSGDNFNTDDLTSNEGLDSRVEDNVASHDVDK